VHSKSKTLRAFVLVENLGFLNLKPRSRIKYSGNTELVEVKPQWLWMAQSILMPGSRNEDRMVNANCNSDGNVDVNSNLDPDNRNPNIGGRFAGVSYKCLREMFRLVCNISLNFIRRKALLTLLWSVSSRLACGRFLEDYFPTLCIFCCQKPYCLLRA